MNQLTKKLYSRLETISLYGIGQIIWPLCQLIISLLIAQYHAIVLWGDYVENLIVVNLIMLFASFGHRDFLLKEFGQTINSMGELWGASLISRLIICIICITGSLILGFFTINNVLIVCWVLLLFIANSFAVIMLFKRDFKFQLLVEATFGALLVAAVYFYIETLTVTSLVIFISSITVLKVLTYSLKYSDLLKRIKWALPSYELLKRHFHFFTPSALGTLQGTSDVYIVAYLLSNKELGYYHIIVKLMGLGKMAGNYMLAPYVKNLYRLSQVTLSKLIHKAVPWSFLLALLISIVIYVILNYNFSLQLTILDYVLIFLFFPPFFIYTPSLYYLLGIDLQSKVTTIMTTIMAVSVALGFILVFNFKLTGGIATAVASQWLAAIVFYNEFKKVRVVKV